jgi:ribosomal protein S18 acetylase RimI-like enzyme
MTEENAALVRRAGPEDAELLASMAIAFHTEDGHPLSEEGVAALCAMLEPSFNEGLVILLFAGGAACGYGVLSHAYGIENGGRETFLEDLYVAPEFRGLGYGRLLYQALEEEARAAGLHAIHLEVMGGNQAERWYRRMGYRDRGSILLTKPL